MFEYVGDENRHVLEHARGGHLPGHEVLLGIDRCRLPTTLGSATALACLGHPDISVCAASLHLERAALLQRVCHALRHDHGHARNRGCGQTWQSA